MEVADICLISRHYVELALTTFNDTTDDLSDTPTYLYDDCLNDYRYLYGYETWLRAVPIALAYQVLEKCNIYVDTMNNLEIDHVGVWFYRKPVGEEIIKNNYSRGIDAVSLPNQQMMYERMKENVDTKLTTVIHEDNEYVFYWPPYSILFWYDVQNGGYLETYLNIKEYINQTLLQYPNVRVYDFQYDQRIMDLNHYRDTVHYGKELNDWMVDCFANEEHLLDNSSMLYGTEEIQKRLVEFQDQDQGWMRLK